jgi:Ca2+-binding EF-hand superfamily protein
MGNFGWANSNSKEIEEILINGFDRKLGKPKEQFSFDDVLEHVSRRFVSEGGKESEFSEMFSIFDKKGKGEIGLADFRAVFEQFVDIYITDEDINSCIERIAGEGQKTISAGLLAEK